MNVVLNCSLGFMLVDLQVAELPRTPGFCIDRCWDICLRMHHISLWVSSCMGLGTAKSNRSIMNLKELIRIGSLN